VPARAGARARQRRGRRAALGLALALSCAGHAAASGPAAAIRLLGIQETEAGTAVVDDEARIEQLSALGALVEEALAFEAFDERTVRDLAERLHETAQGAPERLRLFAAYYERRLAEASIARGRSALALDVLTVGLARDHGASPSAGMLSDLFVRELRGVTAETQGGRRFRAYVRAHDAEDRLRSGYAALLAEADPETAAELAHQELGERLELRKEAVRRLIELGLVDRAAAEFEDVRGLLHALWPLRDTEQLAASAEDVFTTGLLEILLELALGRHEDVPDLAADLRALPQAPHVHPLDWLRVDIQVALAEEALAKIEGRAGQGPSPFRSLLEGGQLGLLDPFSRAQVEFAEAHWLLSAGDEAGSDRAFERGSAIDFGGARPPQLERTRLTLELRRARERGADASEVERLRAAFDAELAAWNGERDAGAEQAFLHFAGRTELLAELLLLLIERDAQHGAHAALDLWLEVESLGGLRRRMGAELADRAEFASWMPESAGALLFVPGANRSLALCTRAESTFAVPLPAWPRIETEREGLERALARFVGSAGARGAAELEAARDAVAELVWPEAVARFASECERVAIVAPNNLGYLPFEALPLPSGEPLGVVRAVEYWPSFAVARALCVRAVARPAAEHDLALLVHTRGEEPWTADAGFELSAGDLERLTRLPTARVLEHSDASDGLDWLCTAAARARLWLLVAHGHYDPRVQPSAGLILPTASGPAHPWYHDDPRFAEGDGGPALVAPPLVWLGACGAWRAPFRRGDDGDVQLAGRLLVAGSRAVVQPFTRQRFDDLAALTAPATVGLALGLDPAEALRRARTDARATAQDALGAWSPLLVHVVGSGVPLELATTADELRAPGGYGGARVWFVAAGALAAAAWAVGRRRRERPGSMG
jgi:hypothetical protein